MARKNQPIKPKATNPLTGPSKNEKQSKSSNGIIDKKLVESTGIEEGNSMLANPDVLAANEEFKCQEPIGSETSSEDLVAEDSDLSYSAIGPVLNKADPRAD